MLHDPSLPESAVTMGVGASHRARKSAAAGSIVPQKEQVSQEDKVASRRQMRVAKFSARGPVYQNCKMLSADGSLLCHCDLRKLQWYQVIAQSCLFKLQCSGNAPASACWRLTCSRIHD